MILKINYLSGVPTYRQIMDGIKEELASGRLRDNDEVPSVRALASQIEVNPNTVQRAYRDLIQEGVLYARQGMGFFIRPREALSLDFLEESLKKALVEAKVRNVSKEDLKTTFEKLLGDY